MISRSLAVFFLWLALALSGPCFGMAPLDEPPISDLELVGDWDGTLDTGQAKLHLRLHLDTVGDMLVGTLDSIDQQTFGIPIAKVSVARRDVTLEVKAVSALFRGSLVIDGSTLSGWWQQGGGALALTFIRRAQAAQRRPQTPRKPYPYSETEVFYSSVEGKVHLAGTLTVPRGKGPFPAVLLIGGSGPHDRDEAVFGHRPFLVLADYLSRRGYVVLRTDKRGVGASSGDFSNADLGDFAHDSEAGLAYLRSQQQVDPGSIGVLGHSEGGTVATLIAAQDHAVAFVVLLAAPGVRGADLLVAQMRLIAQAAGTPPAQIERSAHRQLAFFRALASESDPVAFARLARTGLTLAVQEMGIPDSALRQQAKLISSNWFRSFLAYDPVTVLPRLTCPLLALNGAKDVQVPSKENLTALRTALASQPSTNFIELPGLNHLFQNAKTGLPSEYADIEETIAPLALQTISRWIGLQVGLSANALSEYD